MAATVTVSEEAAPAAAKGGRNLRKRETAACPLCFNTFFSGSELEAHVSACLYFLEEASERKKHKKAKTTPPKPTKPDNPAPFSIANNAIPQKLSTPNPKSNVSVSNSNTNFVIDPQQSEPTTPSKRAMDEKLAPTSEWNIPEAPIFRPTSAEFQHPLKYIASIRPKAEKYGICRIIPPYPCETWSKNIDPTSFIFKTKIQNIHQLKTRWQGPNEVFVSGLCAFLDKRGTPLKAIPKVDGRDLDLFKLFVSVNKAGGMQEVNRRDMWKEIADELHVSDSSHRANSALRQHYYKVLYPYELYRKNKRHHSLMASNERAPNVAVSIAEDVQNECLHANNAPGLNDSAEIMSDNEFGFYDGKYFILQKFERMAHAFQRKWFTEKKPDPRAVEQEFWRIVEAADENVQVHYGSDLDVAQHSSGFPRDPPPPSSAISPPLSHWNLNHLPRMEGSVLRHITGQISGVTDPMIYVGMLYSSFCWHTEDNYLYSINYLHKGACKTWYGVPASAATHFESVMKEAVPELFMKHPDLLHLLITMISPAVLLKNNVPIVRTVQEPGQYVITFPQAYHAGFSHGFTCAEAVNFAPADWLPFGTSSVERYRGEQRGGVFSQDQMLCTIAQKDPAPETARFLVPELRRMRDNEQKMRDNLRMTGLTMQMAGGPTLMEGDPSQCKVCRYDCYLSSVTCPCSPQHVACLHHARQLCECPVTSKTIQVRVPLNVIDDLVNLVEARLQVQQQKRPPTTLLRNIHISSPPVAPKSLAISSPSLLLTKENSVNVANKTDASAANVMKSITSEAAERRKEVISTEKLYQNHIPPPPNIPVSSIHYTPVTLTDLTTSVPTTVTHYIAKAAPHPPAHSHGILTSKIPPSATPSFISSKKQMLKEAARLKPMPVNMPIPESVLRKTK